MPIPDGHKDNFKTLQRAVESNDVALLWCWDKKEGRFVAVVCAVNCPDDDDPTYKIVPIATMLGEENPYDRFIPPDHPDYPEDRDVAQNVCEAGQLLPPGSTLPSPPGFPEFGGG